MSEIGDYMFTDTLPTIGKTGMEFMIGILGSIIVFLIIALIISYRKENKDE